MLSIRLKTKEHIRHKWHLILIWAEILQQLVILLRKLPQIRQQDKKVNSHIILKCGAQAPRYIRDMSAEKRAVRSRKAWAPKNPRGPKNLRATGKCGGRGTCPKCPLSLRTQTPISTLNKDLLSARGSEGGNQRLRALAEHDQFHQFHQCHLYLS